MKLQDKVVMNILKHMDTLSIPILNNRLESYSIYLSKLTGISERRLKTILNINKRKKIRLDEVSLIAYALNITLYELFKF